MAETAGEPIEHKTCVLKASIHCEGCKRKVKKILSRVQGVDFVDVDTRQQKVTVSGSLDADTLIKILVKSGKHAQLWPQNDDEKKISRETQRNKEKDAEIQRKMDRRQADPSSDNAAREPQPSPKIELAAKNIEETRSPVKPADGGAAAKVVSDAPVETSSGGVEGKKTTEGCSDAGDSQKAAEQKDVAEKSNSGGSGGGGDGGEGSVPGKKKKKKKQAQSGNIPPSPRPGAAAPAFEASETQELRPPSPANHDPPRLHPHPPWDHYYTPPPPQPVYAMNYNTANPTSSYTTSYYAAPRPREYSYAYEHPGPETEPPPPSELDSRSLQPLDSFEMFSDENPNGCFVM